MDNIKSWKPYKMGKVFTISKGKRLTKENMIPGDLNYLGAISVNNAVRDHITARPHKKGNCITVNYNGSVGEAFYQSEPFWATDDINILELIDREMNEEIALFLCTIIKQNRYRFSYGRKWAKDKMEDTMIMLPTKNNKIDWDYMEKYITNLKIKHITTKIKKSSLHIDTNKWKYVKLSEPKYGFEIKKTKNVNSDNAIIGGKIPYITRTKYDNGEEKKIYKDEHKLNKGNCITIGGEGATAFYQENDFVTGNNITLIRHEKMNKYNGLFITCLLQKEKFKYSYGRAFNKHNVEETKLKLPTINGNIDWDYMEKYIKSKPYADRV